MPANPPPARGGRAPPASWVKRTQPSSAVAKPEAAAPVARPPRPPQQRAGRIVGAATKDPDSDGAKNSAAEQAAAAAAAASESIGDAMRDTYAAFVRRKPMMLGLCCGCHCQHAYEAFDHRGELVATAEEFRCKRCAVECNTLTLVFRRAGSDGKGAPDMVVRRMCGTSYCCRSFCCPKFKVYYPGTQLGGFIYQTGFCSEFKYKVCDEEKNVVALITAPCRVRSPCCAKGDFVLRRPDGRLMGVLKSEWNGKLEHMFPDFEPFGTTFPAELPPKSKVLVLAAITAIDLDFIEVDD